MDTVIVKNSQFYSHCQKRIAKGNVNAEKIEIRLDSEWDNLTVRIHWINVASKVEKKPLLERDKPNTIPWEVLADLGELRMGLVGLDGETVIKPTIWLTYGYVVDGVDPEAGDDPQPPTPNWQQQMVEQAEAAANAAKAAKETADNLQAAAESGEFDGDPGPAGPPGKSPIIQDGNWWLWDVEAQEYRDTGVAASGGGGGTTDYTKLTNKPKINGVELLGNKTAQELNLQPAGDYAAKTDIPDKLPAPYTLTFAGAVEAAYDGSQAITVTIPTIAGPPGVSPTVSTEEIDGGTRVTFTFKGGSETVDILNGKTPVKGVDYFTGAEKQEIAEQAAALVPGGVAGGELLLAEYIHQGNQEIHFTSFDWETGIGECTEPHGLSEATEVFLVPSKANNGSQIENIKDLPAEWVGYNGKIYLLPLTETSVRVVGSDKVSQITVNSGATNNTQISVDKFHFETKTYFSIKNLNADSDRLRIEILSYSQYGQFTIAIDSDSGLFYLTSPVFSPVNLYNNKSYHGYLYSAAMEINIYDGMYASWCDSSGLAKALSYSRSAFWAELTVGPIQLTNADNKSIKVINSFSSAVGSNTLHNGGVVRVWGRRPEA